MKTIRIKYYLKSDQEHALVPQVSDYDDQTERDSVEAANPELVSDYDAVDAIAELVAELKKQKAKDKIAAGWDAIVVINEINEGKSEDIVQQIVTSPNMVAIMLMLMGGGPKTARAAIVAFSSDLYSDDDKALVYAALDPVIAKWP